MPLSYANSLTRSKHSFIIDYVFCTWDDEGPLLYVWNGPHGYKAPIVTSYPTEVDIYNTGHWWTVRKIPKGYLLKKCEATETRVSRNKILNAMINDRIGRKP